MKQPSVTALQERETHRQLVPLMLFPQWEHLPAACQRELVMTLASMLLKRIPIHYPTLRREGDE